MVAVPGPVAMYDSAGVPPSFPQDAAIPVSTLGIMRSNLTFGLSDEHMELHVSDGARLLQDKNTPEVHRMQGTSSTGRQISGSRIPQRRLSQNRPPTVLSKVICRHLQ